MKGLKLLGHPLHPAIVHFPVAAWTVVIVTDILSLWQVSLWLLIIGCVAALGAMTAGFIDLIALPSGEPAQKRALLHMYVMSTAWTVYAVDLAVRFLPPMPWLNIALSVVGFAVLVVGTHFGAQLVYDLGVGQTGRKLS